MTITSAVEIWSGQTSEDEETGARTYEALWRIISDTPTESILNVKAAVPQITAPYVYDTAATATSRSFSRRSDTREVWEATITYEFDPDEPDEPEDNPLDEPAKFRWTSSLELEIAEKDANDKGIVNSAGDYFDPPIEWPVAKWQVNVQKNVSSVPFALLGWAGAINSGAYVVDGVSVETRKSRLVAVEVGDRQQKNEISYRVLTLGIEFSEEEYKIRPLDQGYRIKEGGVLKDILIADEDGNEQRPSSPVLLNGTGGKLSNPTTDNAVFLEFDPPKTPEINFSVLPLI